MCTSCREPSRPGRGTLRTPRGAPATSPLDAGQISVLAPRQDPEETTWASPWTTVRAWRRRFLERRLDGLCDEPRPGVPRKITDADIKALEETPTNATHRSTRSMAAATGMTRSAIPRI
ncbi:helix-turn-helix domain-containing protein [Streptomyces virginiae]|uniref:helix-turn-helix domain-containing protein n=1 Tax=Streptomyces virginiae TaxID=1961 RepID=UPI00352CEBDD